MKFLSLALSVIACAVALVCATVPAHAQGAWAIASITIDPTSPAPSVVANGNATTSYLESTTSMEVKAAAQGSTTGSPSYLGRVIVDPTYDLNFEWSGGGSSGPTITFALAGDSDGTTSFSNDSASANSSGGDTIYSVSGGETVGNAGSWMDQFPAGTEQTITLSGNPTTYTLDFDLFAHATASGASAGSSSASANVDVNPTI